MADNLESYFKKRLSDETTGEGNWNVPSDAVWDKALPEIRKKRGLFIPWNYIYLAGAVLLIGLGLTIWLVDPQDPAPDEQTAFNAPVENDAEEDRAVETGEEIETLENILNEEGEKTSTELSKAPDAVTELSADSQGAAEPSDLSTNSVGGEDVVQEQAPAVSRQDNNYIAVNESTLGTKRDYVEPLYMAASSSGSIDREGLNISIDNKERIYNEIDLTPEKKYVQFNNKGKFAIGAFYAPTFNSTNVVGNLSTASLETGNVFLYSGNFGAELKYHVTNRLAIITGIERSEIKSWSRSEIGFAYNASTESEMPGGDKENTSPVPMNTPFGEINTEITYRFSGEDEIPDGEPMQSLLDTHQEITYFSIPLGVEYSLLSFSRFNWIAEGGVRYNRAYRDATEFTSRILHFDEDMNVVDEVMTNHPTYTVNYLNFYVGTGLNYQFSDSFLVTGSARYFRNITRVNFQDNVSTNVQGFGLKLGFSYFF